MPEIVYADRVKETTTTTGTGTLQLGGAPTGFRTFVSGVGDGKGCYYCIADNSTGDWEVGLGTVTDAGPDTLSRDYVLASSNSGSLVSFAAGTKDVFQTVSAALASSVSAHNRIINGAMRIDQRNSGASLTPTADKTYSVDRWCLRLSQASKITLQQDTSVVPAGFSRSLKALVASAPTIGSGDFFGLSQFIEGLNLDDLGWGSAAAHPVTISFWARSSVTGTYGVTITNGAPNRSYSVAYTISAANSWTKFVVVVPGDQSGTWLKDNSAGMQVHFSLGAGSTYTASTNNTWSAAGTLKPSGGTNWVATAAATFYLTGVQVEAGVVAHRFQVKAIHDELLACYRYFEYQANVYNWPAFVDAGSAAGSYGSVGFQWLARKRADPTVTLGGTWYKPNANNPTVLGSNEYGCAIYTTSVAGSNFQMQANNATMKADAEL